MTARIPHDITHDEFLEAIKPLWDLLGTHANEIVGDIHIYSTRADPFYAFEIKFNTVAPPADAPPSDYPEAVIATGHPQDDEFAIWTHQVSVGVLG